MEKIPCIGPVLARMIWEFASSWGRDSLYVGPLMTTPPNPVPYKVNGRAYFALEDITYPQDFATALAAAYPEWAKPPTQRELAEFKKEFRRLKSFHYVYGFNRKRLECIAGETPRMKLMGIKSVYSYLLDDPERPKYQVPD